MTYLYSEFQLKMPIYDGDNEQKLWIIANLLGNGLRKLFKSPTPLDNYSNGTKFKLDLHILVTNLPTEFQLKMSKYDRDNERNFSLRLFSMLIHKFTEDEFFCTINADKLLVLVNLQIKFCQSLTIDWRVGQCKNVFLIFSYSSAMAAQSHQLHTNSFEAVMFKFIFSKVFSTT